MITASLQHILAYVQLLILYFKQVNFWRIKSILSLSWQQDVIWIINITGQFLFSRHFVAGFQKQMTAMEKHSCLQLIME